jgi:hypothetical protein
MSALDCRKSSAFTPLNVYTSPTRSRPRSGDSQSLLLEDEGDYLGPTRVVHMGPPLADGVQKVALFASSGEGF